MTIEMYEDVMNHLQIDKYRELIIKQDQKITELEKACEETQKLLDKQIEATYRLDKENAELKDGIALKDEEVGCIETDFNTFKSKSKEIIKYLCGMVRELNKPNVQLTNIDYSLSEAEQFLKYSEVEK